MSPSVKRPMTICGVWWRAAVHHVGLSGRDGSLSYTKALALVLVGVYTACALLGRGEPMPTVLACLLVAFSHGTRVGLELIDKWRPTLSASDARSVTIVEHITKEQKEIIERRDPAIGVEPTA